MSFPGKVRRRACGQHTSEHKNARMRGRSCPEAWASPVPERVCPKVRAKPHKSCFFSPTEGRWKRGNTAQNPPGFSRGSLQDPSFAPAPFVLQVTRPVPAKSVLEVGRYA